MALHDYSGFTICLMYSSAFSPLTMCLPGSVVAIFTERRNNNYIVSVTHRQTCIYPMLHKCTINSS